MADVEPRLHEIAPLVFCFGIQSDGSVPTDVEPNVDTVYCEPCIESTHSFPILTRVAFPTVLIVGDTECYY